MQSVRGYSSVLTEIWLRLILLIGRLKTAPGSRGPAPPRNPQTACRGARKAEILVATREAYALLELKQWGETRTNSRPGRSGCSLIW